MRKFRLKEGAAGYGYFKKGKIYDENHLADGTLHSTAVEMFRAFPQDWEEVFDDSNNKPTQEQLAKLGTIDPATVSTVWTDFSRPAQKMSFWGGKEDKNTPVNPQHYKNGEIECIDAIKSATVGKTGFEGYLVGCSIKYLWRFESKGGVTDVEKAIWYLERLKKELDEKGT
jgi:hypothetical protein